MNLQKQKVLAWACGSLHCPPLSTSGSLHSLHRAPPQQRKPRRNPWQYRRYATIVPDDSVKPPNGGSNSSSSFIPPPWPSHPHPTPYQILNHPKSAPYERHTSIFPQLVKLYHPDHAAHACHAAVQSLDPTVRLERYRLIVAAHSLLSDAHKRTAYDTHGLGWLGGAPHPLDRARGSPIDPRWARAASRCATWEDWEALRAAQARECPAAGASDARWHAFFTAHGDRAGKDPPEPIYVVHRTFIVVVLVFTFLGTAVNAMRADSWSTKYVARLDKKHDEASKNLMTARRDTREASKSLMTARREAMERARTRALPPPEEGQGNSPLALPAPAPLPSEADVQDRIQQLKKERLERFLQKRDPAAYRDEGVRKLVLSPEVCNPSRQREGKLLQSEQGSG